MDIFVIGGTGFISSRLVRCLVEDGDYVTVFTRGRTPVPFEPRPRLAVRHGDRHDTAALLEHPSATVGKAYNEYRAEELAFIRRWQERYQKMPPVSKCPP